MHRRTELTVIELLVVLAIVAIIVALSVPAIQAARESARRLSCQNSMKQIGLALQMYNSDHGVYPPTLLHWNPGGPWNQNVPLLPYLELKGLYNAVNLELSAYDSVNTTVTHCSPGIFLCPSDGRPGGGGFGVSNYQASRGSGRFADGPDAPIEVNMTNADKVDGFFTSRCLRTSDVPDGLSNTAAFSEQVHGFLDGAAWDQLPQPSLGLIYEFAVSPPTQNQAVWQCEHLESVSHGTRPAGSIWLFNPGYTHLWPPGKWSCFGGNIGSAFSPITANSRHPKGVNLLLADGHVKFVIMDIDLDIWRAFGSRDGKETVDKQ